MGIDPAAGLPANIRITGSRAQLLSNETVDVSADMDLAVSGPLMSGPRVAGRVGIITMNVSVPDRLPTILRPLPGTRHVQPTPTAAARLALARRRQAPVHGRPFSADLDLVITAQNRIFVRGRSINAELGGDDLRLQGTSRDPLAIGAFELGAAVSTSSAAASTSCGDGLISWVTSRRLDFLAETQAADVTARIAVTGPASRPEFAFSSSPDLPQDEILSRVLFRRPSGGLSAGQALQLAQTVAQLSGGTGTDAFENCAVRSVSTASISMLAQGATRRSVSRATSATMLGSVSGGGQA